MFAVLFKESRSCRLSPKARMGGTRSNSELNADLILLDVGLPELNGIDAASRIREVAPRTKILF